jgi:hypothetical protein
MGSRLELQKLLEKILGTKDVYFQPPPNIQMNYPCIVYQRDSEVVRHAANQKYNHIQRYKVTIIDKDPDSKIRDKVRDLPLCSFSSFFVAENLNHDVFAIYF